MSEQEVHATERISVSDARAKRTRDGYLAAEPRVARTGIQEYFRGELDPLAEDASAKVRIWRPESEVFDRESLKSYANRPVTVGHPEMPVSPSSWKQVAVGQVGSEVVRDGEHVRVPMMVMDQAAIDMAAAEEASQLSLGYTMHVDWTPGTTPDGDEYDGTARRIRANHVALVDEARGGPMLRIGDSWSALYNHPPQAPLTTRRPKMESTMVHLAVDGVPVEMERTTAKVVERALDSAKSRISELEESTSKAAEAIAAKDALNKDLEAKVATLEKAVEESKMTPERLSQLVRDRAAAVEAAEKVSGRKVVDKSASTEDIMRAAVEVRIGDAAKDWTDEQVKASFSTLSQLSDSAQKPQGGHAAELSGALSQAGSPGDSQAEYEQYIQDAWQGLPEQRVNGG